MRGFEVCMCTFDGEMAATSLRKKDSSQNKDFQGGGGKTLQSIMKIRAKGFSVFKVAPEELRFTPNKNYKQHPKCIIIL